MQIHYNQLLIRTLPLDLGALEFTVNQEAHLTSRNEWQRCCHLCFAGLKTLTQGML